MYEKLLKYWKFLTYDIWRITENEVSKRQFSLLTILKTFSLCIERFTNENLINKASALTYSTLLAIVPILAVLFSIARGFGFAGMMEKQFRHGFAGQNDTAEALLGFVDSYLVQTKSSGAFIGIGIILMLWSVINLLNNIEETFNRIWGLKQSRSVYRKITDYFSMILLLPVLIVVSGGLSIFTSTMLREIESYTILTPLAQFLIRLIPFILIWLMFTALYIFMPNTRVKFKYALPAGILTGTAYQLLQYLYITGQVSVSKYNAVYGSFAAVPLLLLWLHLSWTICLFGVELTYAGQNIQNFSFDKDTRNISRRYYDFMALLIMSLIAKRFCIGKEPYTAQMLSREHRIPMRLTRKILYQLQELHLIHEVPTDDKEADCVYIPAMDINKLSAAVLLEKLDTYGSEDFKIDTGKRFHGQWRALLDSKERYYKEAGTILLKDL